jgi:hypothetical protein
MFSFSLLAFPSFLHCMAFSLQDNGVLRRDLRVMHGHFARYPRFSAGPFCCYWGNDSFITYIDLRALDEQQGHGVRHARHIVIIHHVQMFKSVSRGIFAIIMMIDSSHYRSDRSMHRCSGAIKRLLMLLVVLVRMLPS